MDHSGRWKESENRQYLNSSATDGTWWTPQMDHSPKFELVKDYYDSGRWSKKAVKNAVVKGWITAAEYDEITGEVYA